MLIYPFHNDDAQSQLPTRVARVWFGLSFERRNHGGGVGDRRAKQGRDRVFGFGFFCFDSEIVILRVWVWVFLLRS